MTHSPRQGLLWWTLLQILHWQSEQWRNLHWNQKKITIIMLPCLTPKKPCDYLHKFPSNIYWLILSRLTSFSSLVQCSLDGKCHVSLECWHKYPRTQIPNNDTKYKYQIQEQITITVRLNVVVSGRLLPPLEAAAHKLNNIN